jgi:hypothetical protein
MALAMQDRLLAEALAYASPGHHSGLSDKIGGDA